MVMMVRQTEWERVSDIVVRNSGANWSVSWVILYYMCMVVLWEYERKLPHNKQIRNTNVPCVDCIFRTTGRLSTIRNTFLLFWFHSENSTTTTSSIHRWGCCDMLFLGVWSNSATDGTTVIEVEFLQVSNLAVFAVKYFSSGTSLY